MKTIISIGIALIFGWAVAGQGTVKAQNTDGYAFNPYTMSKKPFIQDNILGGACRLIKYPGRIFPTDAFPMGPNAWFKEPNGNGGIEAYPSYPNYWIKVIHEGGNIDEIPYYPNSSIVKPNDDPVLD